jgi:hypothetical protein
MNLLDIKYNISKKFELEDNEAGRDELFVEEIEKILFALEPEKKTELYKINCMGVDVDGFYINEHDQLLRLTYAEYNELDHGIEFNQEKLIHDLKHIGDIRDAFKNEHELENAIDPEDPIYEVYKLLINNKKLKIEIMILTNQVISNNCNYFISGFSNEEAIDIKVYDYNDLNKLLENHVEQNVDVIDFQDYQFDFVKNSTEELDIYFFTLKALDLAKLYDKYGTTLLQDNVRLFLKTSGVNKGIKVTLENNPEYFLSYNNGLSAVCKDIEFDECGKVKNLVSLQIVNGGQTTASLHNAFKENINLKNAYVQVKLTHIKNEDKYSSTVMDIAKYANSQNKINNSDFASADEFFIDFEKTAQKESVSIDGKDLEQYVFFERMRGQKKIEEAKIGKNEFSQKYFSSIDIKTIAQIENISNQLPSKAAGGGEKSLSYFIEKNEEKLTIEKYRTIVAKYLVMKEVERIMEFSDAPGSRYQTSPRAKKFGSVASSIKYYTLSLIYSKMNTEDYEKIYFNKTAYGAFFESFVLIHIEKVFSFFIENEGDINMEARKPKTQKAFNEQTYTKRQWYDNSKLIRKKMVK